ncbi:C39 family peptidase [Methanomicrobium antiquum]|uniref:C39 family peptidase n=1 Tax=Methanomicrobium antiquum TaxID=487686 RepID=A0AAF0JLM8_9EURY|nr:C39 family peptidase [Methanomicrobium antiquum]WFN36267.1 C39 family peptidase [Methanomicrobium antiquum]
MRALSLLLIVALAGAMFVPVVSASTSVNEQLNSTITLDYAKKIAQLHLNDVSEGMSGFSEWTGANVESDLTFYDLNGNIAAYSFSVVKDGNYLGFILISGNKDNYPILEFGKGDIVPEKTKENAQFTAEKFIGDAGCKLDSVKYLYLGATFYYGQYTFENSLQNVKQDVIVDLFNEAVVDLKNDDSSTALTNVKSGSDAISVEDEWTIVNENIGLVSSGATVSTSVRGADTIYWVPLYDQPSGYPNSCAPTASGMILSYWRSNGYSNFPSNGDTLILDLYSAMDTDPVDGTYDSNIEPGIESVCDDYGYDIDAEPDGWGFYFSEVKSEVTADRPMHLAMHGAGTAIGGSTEYGNHSVAAVGWADGSFDAIEINDGWSTSDTRYIAFGNWNSIYPVYIRP